MRTVESLSSPYPAICIKSSLLDISTKGLISRPAAAAGDEPNKKKKKIGMKVMIIVTRLLQP